MYAVYQSAEPFNSLAGWRTHLRLPDPRPQVQRGFFDPNDDGEVAFHSGQREYVTRRGETEWVQYPNPDFDLEKLGASDRVEAAYNLMAGIEATYDGVKLFKRRPVQRRYTDVLMYGVSREGYSVCARVTGYRPYFYIARRPEWSDDDLRHLVHGVLPHAVCRCAATDFKHEGRCTHNNQDFDYDVVPRHEMIGFQGLGAREYVKIYVSEPSMVRKCRYFIEGVLDRIEQAQAEREGTEPRGKGALWPHGPTETFESDMPFVLRFGIDNDESPEKWYAFPKRYCYFETSNELTRCQIEFSCDYRHMREPDDEELRKSFGRRILASFDGEMRPRRKLGPTSDEGPTAFPREERDPILQLGLVWTVRPLDPDTGQDDPLHPPRDEDHAAIFVVGECRRFKRRKDLASQRVFTFDDERTMLAAFAGFLRTLGPDILTGYNIGGFDILYLFRRAARLGVTTFPEWGRRIGIATEPKEETFSSRGFGSITSLKANIPGVSWFDLLYVLKKKEKFRDFTLGAVSNHYLRTTKEDVSPDDIPRLQRTPEGRRTLAIYCIKDCLLVTQILRKLKLVEETTMFCRMIGVTFEQMYSRGMGLKMLSVLCRASAKLDTPYIYKTKFFSVEDFLGLNGDDGGGGGKSKVAGGANDEDDSYIGAIVQEALVGFYNGEDMFVPGLDFASLYPSIMRAENFCSTTWVREEDIDRLGLRRGVDVHRVKDFNEDSKPGAFEYKENPANAWFVDPAVRQGLAPSVLERLAAERNAFKALKKKSVEGSFDYTLYDMSQLAVKYIMNSIYGLFGASTSKFHCKSVAESVTMTGRGYITLTKCYVEGVFRRDATDLLRRELRDLKQRLEATGEYTKRVPALVKKHIFERLDTLVCPFDAKVIYGDTDSIFPLIQCRSMQIAGCWAWVMAKVCTKLYKPPNDLEFEKIFTRLILYSKKRYVAMKWEWMYEMLHIDPQTMTRTYAGTISRAEFFASWRDHARSPPEWTVREYDEVDQNAVPMMQFYHQMRHHPDTGAAYDEWWWVDDQGERVVAGDFKREVQPYLEAGMYVSKLVDVTGLESKRRDNCLHISQGVGKVHYMLITDAERGVENAIRYVQDQLCRPLLNGTIDLWRLITTANLSKPVSEYGAGAKLQRTGKIAYDDDATEDKYNPVGVPLIQPCENPALLYTVLPPDEFHMSGGIGVSAPVELVHGEGADDYDEVDFHFKDADEAEREREERVEQMESGGDGDEMTEDEGEEEAIQSEQPKRKEKRRAQLQLGHVANDPKGNVYVQAEKSSRRAGRLKSLSVDRRLGTPAHVHVAIQEGITELGIRVPFYYGDMGKGVSVAESAIHPVRGWKRKIRPNPRHYMRKLQDVMTRVFAPVFAPGEKDERVIRRRVHAKLFQGPHMMVDSKSTGGGGGGDKSHLFVASGLMEHQRVCLQCTRVIAGDERDMSVAPLCRYCGPKHRDATLDDLAQQLQRLRLDHHALWANCQRCMGTEESARHITCTNSSCEKYWAIRRVDRELETARHTYTSLNYSSLSSPADFGW